MTTQEFSNTFDTLLNSFRDVKEFGKTSSNQSIELDEYEKSVFLTQAQEELILTYYTGKNQFRDSFEKSEEIRQYLNNIVETSKILPSQLSFDKLYDDSYIFELPKEDNKIKVWFKIYESVTLQDNNIKCLNNTKKDVQVIPTSHDSLNKILKNPFKQPNEKRVLRLDREGEVVELISKYNISEYLLRYISKPSPIILTDLTDGLTINGENLETPCKLHPVLHKQILELAVKKAINSKTIFTNNN